MYMLRHMKNSPYAPKQIVSVSGENLHKIVMTGNLTSLSEIILRSSSSSDKPLSPRMQEFKKKLRETSSIKSLEDIPQNHPEAEHLSVFEPWPDNTNPHTGEIGGPTGPEPTRYGDWERKGRVSDF